MTFNYQLAATSSWVKKSYNVHIDQEAPVVESIAEVNGKVRINFADTRVAYAIVGTTKFDVSLDSGSGKYYVELEKSAIEKAIKEAGRTSLSSQRLYIAAVDYARGRTGAIAHFESSESYNKYEMLQGYGLSISNDFSYANDTLKVIEKDSRGSESVVKLADGGTLTTAYEQKASKKKSGFLRSLIEFFARIFSNIFGGK